jgi:peptidoglycan hydrolase-like protein with peptidoglycan-binding domain
MGSVEGMLSAARSLLGTGENPPGSNHNFITTWYGFDGAWCDMAVTYAAGHSDNLAACMGRHAWTVEHAKAFQSAGRWHYGLGGIRAGDIVFFDWSGGGTINGIDHIGVVEAVHSNGTITTLEGNTSNVFARRVRRSSIVGYGRPAYGNAAQMPSSNGTLVRGSTGTGVRTLQANLNKVMGSGLTLDGSFGPATETALRAFQSKYKLIVDGIYGPQSAAMMKGALAGRTSPIPPKPKPPAAKTLFVDGRFGPATCAAMQRALNKHGASLVVDGAMGALTKKALQKYLGVGQDGSIGPVTIKALQRKVGVTQDGVWGPNTTSHLQQKLNAGTF